ncbi:hypothetical protein EES37_00825 [Streptomyces sp. ADI91-18]|nr:hypothetical protein EES37_00825 [Streptomyces sp. ADI91-18]
MTAVTGFPYALSGFRAPAPRGRTAGRTPLLQRAKIHHREVDQGIPLRSVMPTPYVIAPFPLRNTTRWRLSDTVSDI